MAGKERKKKLKTQEYRELGITNNFIFKKVMRNHKLCKQLLEVILGVKIKRIEYQEEEKTIEHSLNARGVRLDVYVEDDENTVYNVEMQTTNPQNLPKRSRYYQGMIDLNLIQKGENYNLLRKSYVIFICTKDIFGKGRHIYTFENICIQDKDIRLNDEATKVFLNPISDMEDEYMTLHMIKREMYDAGKASTLVEAVGNLMKNRSMSLDEACDALGYSVQQYNEATELTEIA